MKIMQSVDTDRNGEIGYSEFISATLDNKLIKNSFSIDKAFRFFDKDRDGQIDKDELQKMLQGSELNHVETNIIKDILLEWDENGDGVIDKDEFYRWMSFKQKPMFIPQVNPEVNPQDVIVEEDTELGD